MERVYKSVTDRQRIWSIIIKRGKYHFRGDLNRCDCYHPDGYAKIRFHYKEVAELYSEYQFVKYDRQHTSYWSDDCNCWHLRTSRPECGDALWVRH